MKWHFETENYVCASKEYGPHRVNKCRHFPRNFVRAYLRIRMMAIHILYACVLEYWSGSDKPGGRPITTLDRMQRMQLQPLQRRKNVAALKALPHCFRVAMAN